MLRYGWLALALVLSTAFARAADDALTVLSKTATAWVHTRSEAVRAQSEWTTQRDLLASTVQQLKDRAHALEEQRDSVQAKGARDRAEVAALQQSNDGARARLAAIEAALRKTDVVLLEMRPQLPPRLSAALDLPYRTLAQNPPGLGERMQATVAILARAEQFNHTVTTGQEIVAAEGLSNPKLLDTVYWGLADGYAYDRGTGQAWIGLTAAGGWRWQACPAAAPALRTLLAAHEDRAEPQLVDLPAQLARTTGGTP